MAKRMARAIPIKKTMTKKQPKKQKRKARMALRRKSDKPSAEATADQFDYIQNRLRQLRKGSANH